MCLRMLCGIYCPVSVCGMYDCLSVPGAPTPDPGTWIVEPMCPYSISLFPWNHFLVPCWRNRFLSSVFSSGAPHLQCYFIWVLCWMHIYAHLYICTRSPDFLSHPLIMFFRGRSRSDFLLQLSWCFLFILERCLNKGLDALLLIPRCLSWQRTADGTELRG